MKDNFISTSIRRLKGRQLQFVLALGALTLLVLGAGAPGAGGDFD
ncbi:MAG: hypothetical protein R3C14_09480 [Caldilineaceae bacterium]